MVEEWGEGRVGSCSGNYHQTSAQLPNISGKLSYGRGHLERKFWLPVEFLVLYISYVVSIWVHSTHHFSFLYLFISHPKFLDDISFWYYITCTLVYGTWKIRIGKGSFRRKCAKVCKNSHTFCKPHPHASIANLSSARIHVQQSVWMQTYTICTSILI